MRLTAKGRYAVTAMLDIALQGDCSPVSLSDIAERQGISKSYLEQLFTRLRRAQLVRSVRGPSGGYCLAVGVEEITVADVVRAVNESIDATRCGGRNNCQDNQPCLTHTLWEDLGHEIERFLQEITLADILRRQRVRETASRQNQKFSQNHEFSLTEQEVAL